MALHQQTAQFADVDPLQHHYIYTQSLAEMRHQRGQLENAVRDGHFQHPHGWDVKAAERDLANRHLGSYKAQVRQASLHARAERTRNRTKNEQWGDSAQGYFRMIEDKVLTGIAAETHRQWREERDARRLGIRAAEQAEVDAIGQRMTGDRMLREAQGVGMIGPTHTVSTHPASMLPPSQLASTLAPPHTLPHSHEGGSVLLGGPHAHVPTHTHMHASQHVHMHATHAPTFAHTYDPHGAAHMPSYMPATHHSAAPTVSAGGFGAFAAQHMM